MLWNCLLLYKERITLVGNVMEFMSAGLLCYWKHRDQSGCDVTVFQQFKMGTKYVAAPCDVCGAQGLPHPKSCDVSGWCDVCPP